mgnify:CR=1 FL=1
MGLIRQTDVTPSRAKGPKANPSHAGAWVRACSRHRPGRVYNDPESSFRSPLRAMRFFNTAGPVPCNIHYCLSPLERIDLVHVLTLLEQRKYFVLHAPRQTGKTTVLLALQSYLNQGDRRNRPTLHPRRPRRHLAPHPGPTLAGQCPRLRNLLSPRPPQTPGRLPTVLLRTRRRLARTLSVSGSRPQLLLQAFLQRIVNSGGRVEREYGLGRRRTDLLILWPLPTTPPAFQRAVIELKLLSRSREATIAEGLAQTRDYADRCGADETHLVIFDRRPGVPWDEKIFCRQETFRNRPITVWGM